MQPQYPLRETLHERLERDLRNIVSLLDEPHTGGQVLERLPSGEYAWLRPEHHPIRVIEPLTLPRPDDDTRYWPTWLARRAIAIEVCFGPWPSLAEASSTDEHWGVA